jgi:hypothetical protein
VASRWALGAQPADRAPLALSGRRRLDLLALRKGPAHGRELPVPGSVSRRNAAYIAAALVVAAALAAGVEVCTLLPYLWGR